MRAIAIKKKVLGILSLAAGAIVLISFGLGSFSDRTVRSLVRGSNEQLPALMLATTTLSSFQKYAEDTEIALATKSHTRVYENRVIIDEIIDSLGHLAELLPDERCGMIIDDLGKNLVIFRDLSEKYVDAAMQPHAKPSDISTLGREAQSLGLIIADDLEDLKKHAYKGVETSMKTARLESHRGAIAITVCVTILTLGCVLLLLSTIIGMSKHLRTMQYHFARTHLRDIEPLRMATDSDELNDLIVASNEMLASFKASTADLIDKSFIDSLIISLPEMIIITDSCGVVLHVNGAVCRALGSSEDRIKGLNIVTILGAMLTRASNDKLTKMLGNIKNRAAEQTECLLQKNDGLSLPALVSVVPMLDRQGNFLGSVIAMQDLTELKKSEEARIMAEKQLMQASKLASLGTLGAGVAHELNNPLVAVKGFAELLLADSATTDSMRDKLAKIVRAGERMQKITDHLRKFSTDTSRYEMERISIEKPVNDSLILMEQRLTMIGVKFQLNFSPKGRFIKGDSNQLESVFQNLISNSFDAFKEHSAVVDKTISISTSISPSGNELIILYRDNAGGIPEIVRKRIYDPFFTTKQVGKGTGLGLSISRDIVVAHGGSITLLPSEAGITLFEVVLPLAKSQVELVPETEESLKKSEKNTLNKRLLIVDDEKYVLDILEGLLGEAFSVVSQDNPEMAMDLIAGEKFDAIVTDMRMPKYSGLDIIDHARKTRPDTPIVVITALSKTDKDVTEALQRGAVIVLPKFFKNRDDLITVISNVITEQQNQKNTSAPTKIHVEETSMPETNTKSRVLLIDDDVSICELMKAGLEIEFDVVTHADASQAMQSIKNEHFDLIITDFNMPGFDGTKILKYVKELNLAVPIILMSGSSPEDPYIMEAIASGQVDFVPKPPPSLKALRQKIKERLASWPNRAAA